MFSSFATSPAHYKTSVCKVTATREIQIRPVLSSLLDPIRIAKTRKTSVWGGCGERGSCIRSLLGVPTAVVTMGMSMAPQEARNALARWPNSAIPGINLMDSVI